MDRKVISCLISFKQLLNLLYIYVVFVFVFLGKNVESFISMSFEVKTMTLANNFPSLLPATKKVHYLVLQWYYSRSTIPYPCCPRSPFSTSNLNSFSFVRPISIVLPLQSYHLCTSNIWISETHDQKWRWHELPKITRSPRRALWAFRGWYFTWNWRDKTL